MKKAKVFPPADDGTYPALRFQRLFQMEDKEIGCRWRMPIGMSMAAVEGAMWKNGILQQHLYCELETRLTNALAEQHPDVAARFALASNIADAFILLNSDLRRIEFERTHWRQLYGFLHGVVSGFNPDDMQAWIDDTINHGLLEELQNYIKEEFNAPEAESVYPPQLRRYFNTMVNEGRNPRVDALLWLPSEKTVYRIYDAFQARRDFKYGMPKP